MGSDSDASPSEDLETHRSKVRQNVASMSLEELRKLKAKIKAEILGEAMEEDAKTKEYKRANKNRPREMSAKIKVPLVERKLGKKKVHRDPRFDPLCGNYDEKTFKTNYKFVKDIKVKEKEQLEKQLRDCEDDEEKEKIKFVIQRLSNQIREQEKREEKEQKEYEERQEIKHGLKHGKKMEYKKKSTKKIEELVDKYEKLKKDNKLQKHMERKQKKLVRKDSNQIKKIK